MKQPKAFPWGIVAGACAIVAFYGIVAFVGAYLLFSAVAGQTNETVGMFDSWW